MENVDKLLRTLKGLLRLARIVSSGSDDKSFPIQQIEYLGKNCDATMWLPYGMHANLPPDVLAIAISLNGNTETRYAFPSSPDKRSESPLPNPLSEGDLLLFNPVSKAYVYFKADGTIKIDTSLDLDVAVAGNLTAVITGNANIVATNIVLSGVTDINGTVIDLTGKITGAADVISGTGKSLSLHTHAQGVDSSADTQVETNVPT